MNIPTPGEPAASSPPAERALFAHFARRLTADSLRYVPAAVVPACAAIVSVSIFTRLFEADDYGRYALVIAATAIVISFLSGWVRQSVLRYLPRFSAENRLVEFKAKFLVLLAAIAVAVIVVFLALRPALTSWFPAYRQFMVPAVVLVITEIMIICVNTVFQADLRSALFSSYRAAWALLRLTLALLYVWLIQREVVGLVVGAAFANLLVLIPMIGHLGLARRVGLVLKSFDMGFVGRFAAYGLPMTGWMIGGQVLALSDRFIIGAFRETSEVGIYSANYNLVVMGFGLVSTPVLTACYPLIMTAWEKGQRQSVPGLISAFSKYYLMAIVPVVVLLAVFSRDVVALVLGADFREGFTIVPFVLGGAAVWGLAMVGHKGLEIMERTRVMLAMVALCAAVNIVLNLVFVPKFGYQGAAVTTFVSYALYPVLVHGAVKHLIPWRMPWRHVGKVAFAGVVSGAASLAVAAGLLAEAAVLARLIIGGAAGLAAYFGVLILVREVRVADLKSFKQGL